MYGNQEERIEVEVRRRLAAALRSNGWGDEGVAREVLYWLPPRFVAWYGELSDEALNLTGASAAKSGAGQRTTGDEAEIKAKVAARYRGKRVGSGVGGGGKKYVRVPEVVRNERKFEVKGEVDRFLLRIADSGGRLCTERVGEVKVRDIGGRRRKVCDECGKLMNSEWLRCPFHEA